MKQDDKFQIHNKALKSLLSKYEQFKFAEVSGLALMHVDKLFDWFKLSERTTVLRVFILNSTTHTGHHNNHAPNSYLHKSSMIIGQDNSRLQINECKLKGVKLLSFKVSQTHVAIFTQSNSTSNESKYELCVFDEHFQLVASKQCAYEMELMYIDSKELICASLVVPVQVFELANLSERLLFSSLSKEEQLSRMSECFAHRSFWLCAADDERFYVDNRNHGLYVICRRTGEIQRKLKARPEQESNAFRSKLPCAVVCDSQLVLVNDSSKTLNIFDVNGNLLEEQSIHTIDNLSERFLLACKEHLFYLIKKNSQGEFEIDF